MGGAREGGLDKVKTYTRVKGEGLKVSVEFSVQFLQYSPILEGVVETFTKG